MKNPDIKGLDVEKSENEQARAKHPGGEGGTTRQEGTAQQTIQTGQRWAGIAPLI
jgi:hypothetical protein